MTISLSQEDYEALVALAQRGVREPDGSINQQEAVVLDTFLQNVERLNGIKRYSLWVQWTDPTAPLPPGIRFPETWPPHLRQRIQFISRSISKTDVLNLVNQRTPNALDILVTPDPAALLGWTDVRTYFTQP